MVKMLPTAIQEAAEKVWSAAAEFGKDVSTILGDLVNNSSEINLDLSSTLQELDSPDLSNLPDLPELPELSELKLPPLSINNFGEIIKNLDLSQLEKLPELPKLPELSELSELSDDLESLDLDDIKNKMQLVNNRISISPSEQNTLLKNLGKLAKLLQS